MSLYKMKYFSIFLRKGNFLERIVYVTWNLVWVSTRCLVVERFLPQILCLPLC